MKRLKRNTCACAVCASYCEHVPGWYLPDEIEPAAMALGLTVEAFFRQHCTLDYWVGDFVAIIRPRRIDEPGGQLAEYDPRGTCAHLVNGRCAVHATKPYECAVSHHAKDAGTTHQDVANAWRTEQAQHLVRQVYGSYPEEPDHDIGDVFSLLFSGLSR